MDEQRLFVAYRRIVAGRGNGGRICSTVSSTQPLTEGSQIISVCVRIVHQLIKLEAEVVKVGV